MSQPGDAQAEMEEPRHDEVLADVSGTPDSSAESKTTLDNDSDESKLPSPQAQPRRVVMQQPVISYQGIDMSVACAQGSLPTVVLLWGMATPRGINIMLPNAEGNNPAHFAVLAPTNEVLVFLAQQTRGMAATGERLVDSRNDDGETPLHRAMVPGRLANAKFLLQIGADPLLADGSGKTVIINAAKNKQLYCLHFMVSFIQQQLGDHALKQILNQRDIDGHGPLDWAAFAGDVNVLEYLLRKGADLNGTDDKGRTTLFWAIKEARAEAARFLVLCGIDPLAPCSDGKSAVEVAKSRHDDMMVAVLEAANAERLRLIAERHGADEEHGETSLASRAFKEGYAIHRLVPSRWSMILSYALFSAIVWVSMIYMPWYAWVLSMGAMGYLFNYLATEMKKIQQISGERRVLWKAWHSWVIAPEKYLGFWLGTFTVIQFYLIWILVRGDDTDSSAGQPQQAADRLRPLTFHDVYPVVYASFAVSAIVLAAWLHVVWWDTDPGVIRTRDHDFEEVLQSSLVNDGAPDSDLYCRTTLVRKPIRSKYCTQSTYVVARMDHWCVWLNTTIGYRNHRPFVIYVFGHFILNVLFLVATCYTLIDEFTERFDDASLHYLEYRVLGRLFSNRYFFMTCMTLFVFAVTGGLVMLINEQGRNMLLNRTTNERINASRYPWMMPYNRFDRGMWSNFLEFWRVPGYAVNYMEVFEIPETNRHGQRRKPPQACCSTDHGHGGHNHSHGHSHSHSHDGVHAQSSDQTNSHSHDHAHAHAHDNDSPSSRGHSEEVFSPQHSNSQVDGKSLLEHAE